MQYGFYERENKDSRQESKLSTYSESKEKKQYKINQQEQKLSTQQNSTKGISFGSIKNTGSDAIKESSKEGSKSIMSAATSKAPSVAVQVIDKAKEGLEKALEYAKPNGNETESEEQNSAVIPGILAICSTIFFLSLTIPTLFMPLMPMYSVLLFLTGGAKETEIKQVKHAWYPYERNQECETCSGTGLTICQTCSGTLVEHCDTCNGVGYTYVVRNKSGVIFTQNDSYTYRSYRIESGCIDCGGSGNKVAYYDALMGNGNRICEEDRQAFFSGGGTKECTTCHASGRTDKCLSCNGYGVYYKCIRFDCPYNEWNHWESLGVDMNGICFEREVEVEKSD